MDGDTEAAAQQRAAAHVVPWPRPAVTLGACLEVAGWWWALVTAGLLLLVAVLIAVQRLEAQSLGNARLEITLEEVRERLEADLSLGFELGASSRAQPLLEDMLARDPRLLAAEVFDPAGVSLFNTDRGAIGERIPDAWRGALAAAGGRWSAEAFDEVTLGLPIRGAFGEIAGHVSVTAPLVQAPPPWMLFGLAAVVWLALSGVAWLLVRRSLRAQLPAQQDDPLGPAAERLARAHRRMDATLAALARDEGAAG
ncbi:MAG TPA: hypothetical protein VFE82_18590 [Ramlibacter sp.]|jgi:uncharacterized membrane-anchored protein YhcB (DUF1043 family)|uniref:hypothetical protein n=1 Tax=Ramlibacter sp. TaxID=1917967 RepID=UPI002D2BFA72|nr:hypothetical protein [Ramlibacter sp.]HZY20484.1 hypothetical protein [Ramlibacter sp.]